MDNNEDTQFANGINYMLLSNKIITELKGINDTLIRGEIEGLESKKSEELEARISNVKTDVDQMHSVLKQHQNNELAQRSFDIVISSLKAYLPPEYQGSFTDYIGN